MPLWGHKTAPADEPAALWWGRGPELARRVVAFIETKTGQTRSCDDLLEDLRDVVYAEYNPIEDELPTFGDPPRRGAARGPTMTEPGS